MNRPTTVDCEVCSVSKAHHIVSQQPAPRSETPYERICFDLIQMTRGYNGDQWIAHFLCDCTRMNHVYTQSRKSLTLQTIKEFTAFVRRQYGQAVQIIHLDGETSLGNDFDNWVAQEGIAVERSAPYTPAQNGAAERSGGVIVTKARAMQIGARLPEELWPEAAKTAAYLVNRSPSKQLDWKTPLETLQRALGRQNPSPSIAHLRVYGCRAYPLNPRIPRKKKLEPRAHIGYLVGYNSTNIFRIWVPSEKKVIATRDVTFNETRFYDPEEPDLASQLHE